MTTVERVLARAKSAADQRQAAEDTAYRKLVAKVARGGDVTPEQIFAQLVTRDVERFRADVEAVVRRLACAAEAAALPARVQELADLRAKISATEDEYTAAVQAANKKYAEKMPPLKAAEREQERLIRSAETARSEVLETADAEVLDKLKAAEKEARDAAVALGGLENELSVGERTPVGNPTRTELNNSIAGAARVRRLEGEKDRQQQLRDELIPAARQRVADANKVLAEAQAAAAVV